MVRGKAIVVKKQHYGKERIPIGELEIGVGEARTEISKAVMEPGQDVIDSGERGQESGDNGKGLGYVEHRWLLTEKENVITFAGGENETRFITE